MSFVLDRIKAGTRNSKAITWPGTETPINLRVLSNQETQAAMFAAVGHFNRAEVPADRSHTIEDYEQEKTIQQLYRALSSADPDDAGKPITKNIDTFRALVNREEVNALVEHYREWERECSPNPEHMDADAFEEFLETLKKKPDAIIGLVSNIALARRLLRSLVSPLST